MLIFVHRRKETSKAARALRDMAIQERDLENSLKMSHITRSSFHMLAKVWRILK